MKNGKYARRRGVASKVLVMLLAVTMIVGISVGGTLAWLSDKTPEVTNVFTDSNIEAGLEETKKGDNNDYNYKMIPGWTIDKDPKAWVTAESEDCYLFVKIEESTETITVDGVAYDFDDFLTYAIADGWTALNDADQDGIADDGIYYRTYDSKATDGSSSAKGTKYSILSGDKVTVKDTVTKEMMDAVTTANQPKLTFTAYAIQMYKDNTTRFSASEAWAKVNAVTPGAGQGDAQG